MLIFHWFLVCLAPFAFGQTEPVGVFEIGGKVEEFGLSGGLAGVDVFLDGYEGTSASSRRQLALVATSGDGAFSFRVDRPGAYRVSVQKTGYLLPGSSLDGFRYSAEITVDDANPKRNLSFQLARPASVFGTIIDQVSRLPVAGVTVYAAQYTYSAGRAILVPADSSATTGPQGYFRLRDLIPGPYVIVVGPRRYPSLELQPHSGSREWEPESDYDTTYWPGGFGLENASPIALPSAAQLNLGALSVRTVPKKRVSLSLAGSQCEGIEQVNVAVKAMAHVYAIRGAIVGKVPCGGAATLRGFAPGQYELELQGESSATGPPLTASARFQVDHHDTSISVPLPRAVFITGVARPAEGAKFPDLASVRLRLEPTTYSLVRHGPIPLSAAGHFKIENVGMREYRLRVSGIPDTHYLQEVRYNGIPMPDRVFTLNSGAPEHALELIFDDRPAAIAGTVKVDGKPVPRAQIILAPFPVPEGSEFFAGIRSATADDKGNFALVAIPPGEYRLFALPAESRNLIHRPGEAERLTRDADKITLSRGQTRVANLTLAK